MTANLVARLTSLATAGHLIIDEETGRAIERIIEVEAVEPRDYTAKDGSLKTSYDIKLPRNNFGEVMKRNPFDVGQNSLCLQQP